jgi:hypothetical protein
MALIASVHRQTRLKINNEARHTHRMDVPAHSGECINTASKHGAHQMHTGNYTYSIRGLKFRQAIILHQSIAEELRMTREHDEQDAFQASLR